VAPQCNGGACRKGGPEEDLGAAFR
jgi:hypothetical protein